MQFYQVHFKSKNLVFQKYSSPQVQNVFVLGRLKNLIHQHKEGAFLSILQKKDSQVETKFYRTELVSPLDCRLQK
jgi:hypothetical protein